MKTIIDINSTVHQKTAPVVVSLDRPAIPAVGDDVAIPTPILQPQPNSYQQLQVTKRIFRYMVDGGGNTYLYLLLVTDSPIS